MAAKRIRASSSPYAPTAPATGRQEQYLAAIGELTAELGRAPSTGEVAGKLGITARGARKELQRLERQGRLAPAPITTMTGWAQK